MKIIRKREEGDEKMRREIPDNVLLTGDECGREEVCIDYKKCPAYLAVFNNLTTVRFSQPRKYKHGMTELKKKICEKRLKKICCEVQNSSNL